MQPVNDFWIYFYAIAVAQGIFLAVVLFIKPQGKRKANRLLAALIFLLSIYLADIFAGFLGFFYQYPHFLHITTPWWYLFPVLMYFYIKTLLGEKIEWSFKSVVHLLPFIYIMCWIVPFYFLPGEIKLEHLSGQRPLPGGSILTYLYLMTAPVQLLFYVFLIFKKMHVINTTKLAVAHYRWIILFVVLMGLFGFFQLIALNIYVYNGYITLNFKFFPLAFFSFIIYAVGYLAVIEPEIVAPQDIFSSSKKNDIVLDENLLKQYATRILEILDRDKPFLDADFRYSQLAAQLGISARYLSEILNRKIGKSFNDLMNEQRVKEVQKRLLNGSSESYTLLAIAIDSGFNSKASFNRIFKKHTGMTPSEFISHKNNTLLH